jgi:hypothetical protein
LTIWLHVLLSCIVSNIHIQIKEGGVPLALQWALCGVIGVVSSSSASVAAAAARAATTLGSTIVDNVECCFTVGISFVVWHEGLEYGD